MGLLGWKGRAPDMGAFLLRALVGVLAGLTPLMFTDESKFLLLALLMVLFALCLTFLGRAGLARPALFFCLGFSLIIAPNKYFGQPILTHFAGAQGIFLSLTDMAVICLVLLGPLRRMIVTDRRAPRPGAFLALMLLGYAVAMLLSMVNSMDRFLSMAQFLFEMKCLLLFALVGFWTDPEEEGGLDSSLYPALLGLAAGVLAESAIVLAEYKGMLPSRVEVLGIQVGGVNESLGADLALRVGGTYRHPNFLAAPMAMLAALLVSAAFIRSGFQRVIFALAAGGALITLVLTLSRAGWLGCGLAGLVYLPMAVVVLGGTGVFRRNKKLVATVLAVLAIVGWSTSDLIARKLFHSDPVNVSSRMDLNRMAMEMIQAHPLLGVGLNNSSEASRGFSFSQIYAVAFGLPPVVHNVYLLLASEIGVPGTAAFLLAVLAVLVSSWRSIRLQAPVRHRIVLAGLAAGLCAWLAADMFGFNLRKYETAYLIWFLLGAAVLLSRQIRLEAGAEGKRP